MVSSMAIFGQYYSFKPPSSSLAAVRSKAMDMLVLVASLAVYWFCVWSMVCCAELTCSVVSSCAIILGEKESWVLYFTCFLMLCDF